MAVTLVVFALLLILGLSHPSTQDSPGVNVSSIRSEDHFSGNVINIMKHFEQLDISELPLGLDVPEPVPVSDITIPLTFGTLQTIDMNIFGLSEMKMLSVSAEITSMEIRSEVGVEKLKSVGNYTLKSWLGKAEGPMTADIYGVTATMVGKLVIEKDGKLRTQNVTLDVKITNMVMHCDNLGFLGNVFRKIVDSVGMALLDKVKPVLLQCLYHKTKRAMDEKIELLTGDLQLPEYIKSFDTITANARKKILEYGLDPLILKDHNCTLGIATVTLSKTYVLGVANFYRDTNITFTIKKNTLIADFEIITQKLEGVTDWQISMIDNLVSRSGTTAFFIEYISARVLLARDFATTKKIKLRDLDLQIGNIGLRFDGVGRLDTTINIILELLPKLLKNLIMDAIKGPVKIWIQKQLDQLM